MTEVTLYQPEWMTFRTRIEALVKHLPGGAEFWSARDLQEFFEYSTWQKFKSLITRAVESVQTAGLCPEDHFNRGVKMVGNWLRRVPSRNGLPGQPLGLLPPRDGG